MILTLLTGSVLAGTIHNTTSLQGGTVSEPWYVANSLNTGMKLTRGTGCTDSLLVPMYSASSIIGSRTGWEKLANCHHERIQFEI